MQSSIRKATFILRLWTNDNPVENNALHGTVDHIESGLPYPFDWDAANSPVGDSVKRAIPLSKEIEVV
jgi:hypothetical protein